MNRHYLTWLAQQSDCIRNGIEAHGANTLCSIVFEAAWELRQARDAATALGFSHRDDDMGAIIAAEINKDSF
jgi:hypothetical protein